MFIVSFSTTRDSSSFLCSFYLMNRAMITFRTRMHSSRMRTVRCSNHLGGGGTCRPSECGIYPGGRCLPRECLSRVCLLGVSVPYTLPNVNRITDACENITLPQKNISDGKNPISVPYPTLPPCSVGYEQKKLMFQ